MTNLKQAIRDAVEKGGYGILVRPFVKPLILDWSKVDNELKVGAKSIFTFVKERMLEERILLNPAFWKALGKDKGWDAPMGKMIFGETIQVWEFNWLTFIHHLAAGKDVESFFETL